MAPTAVAAFDLSPRPGFVAEYFNTALGHYFYTPHPGEQQFIDAGLAGAGWVRTGLGFEAWPSLDASRYLGSGPACDTGAVRPCRPVTRFYGTPGLGPNSHFFTGFAAEVEALASPASGWSREGVSFYVPLPDAQGICAAGLTPIYRLYNNRWMHNDSNHRYAANARARQLVREAGWTEEGVAFCAYSAGRGATHTMFYKNEARANVVSNAECRASASGSCVGLFNLPLEMNAFAGLDPAYQNPYFDPFNRQVGWAMPRGTILATLNAGREIAAANSFVHLSADGTGLGLHLNTANRLASPLTAITPLRKGDPSLRPFQVRYGTEYELVFDFHVGLNKIMVTGDSAAYGASSIEFRDMVSGRIFQFNALAYGTMPGGTYLGPDVKTGVPIVGVSFGDATSYARLTGPYLRQGSPEIADRGQSFRIAIDREAFAMLLAAARSVDPALSADPLDYVVDNFGMVNEVAGDGEIGAWVWPPSMSLVPRP